MVVVDTVLVSALPYSVEGLEVRKPFEEEVDLQTEALKQCSEECMTKLKVVEGLLKV